VVWLPPKAKAIEIPGERVEGGFAKVRQVRIMRMENVPSDINFAGKQPRPKMKLRKGMNSHWRL
jgi:hypothetical protein